MYNKEQIIKLCSNAINVAIEWKSKGYNQTAIETKKKQWLENNIK